MKLRTRDKVFIFIVLSIIIFAIFFCVISLGYFFITHRTADIKKIDLEYVLESFKIFWFYVVAGLATGLIDFYLIVWMINYHNSKPTKIIDKEERATSTMYGNADFMTDEEKLENFGCDLSEEVEEVKVKFGEINNQGTANNINKDENDQTVYNHPELNGFIKVLRIKTAAYFKKYLEPALFKYELLK